MTDLEFKLRYTSLIRILNNQDFIRLTELIIYIFLKIKLSHVQKQSFMIRDGVEDTAAQQICALHLISVETSKK